jgi:hypothetical protein
VPVVLDRVLSAEFKREGGLIRPKVRLEAVLSRKGETVARSSGGDACAGSESSGSGE